MNLPELPAELDRWGYGCGVEGLRSLVRSYGEECTRMERERCAKVADQYATSGGWTGRYFDGYVDAAKAIASALRDGWKAGDDYRDVIRKEQQ